MRSTHLAALAIIAFLAPSVALAQATPKPAEGGAFQRSSTEGCMNTFLFDGVWRVKVLSVDPSAQYNDGSAMTGVGVKLQVRNGTSKEIAPDDTGFSDINGRGIDLAYSDDNTTSAVGAGTNLTTALTDKRLPPGGSTTLTVYFPYGADKTAVPTKLLIAVDPSKNRAKSHYSTKAPSFRIHLDCGAVANK